MGFWERSKEMLNKGVMSTKEVIETAGEKSKELGEKGAAKLTIMQLERQAENRFAQIGRHVYEILVKEEQHTISKNTDEIKILLNEVEKIENDIDEYEKTLRS